MGLPVAGAVLLLPLACAPMPAPAPTPTTWPGAPPADGLVRPRAARPAAVRPASADRTLPSGLHVVLDEDPDATAAGVISVVRGGSEEDPPGQEGLGHLVEHLTYRAVDPMTPSPTPAAGERPLSRWDRLTKDATVEMNGHTTPDCLLFYEVGPTGRLTALLGLEAARLAAPLVGVDQAAFALERRIIGSEHLVRADPRSPGWAVMQLFPSLFPAGHAYARPTGGTEESRRTLTLADARAYAARVFRPERTTLLVTAPPGAISLQAIVDSLPAALREKDTRGLSVPAAPAPAAAATPAPAAASAPAVPATAAPLRLERRGSPLARPELWLGWALPGSFGESAMTEEVLERWVDNDLGSKDLLREEHHIQQTVTLLHPGRQASVLFIRVLLADGADPDRVAQVVVARVASLWAREATAQETFLQLRTFADTQRLLDEPGQLPRALEQAMRAALGPQPPGGPNANGTLTVSTLARFAYQWLTRAGVRATLFTPAPPARRPGASAEAPIAARALGTGPDAPGEIVPGAAAWSADELRRLVPAAPTVAVKTLGSGLTVITVRRPGAAAVAWLGFRGGTADADPPLLAEMATHARPEARQAIRMHVLPGRGVTKDLSFDTVEFAPAQLSAALTILFAKATSPLRDWPDREGLERLLSPLAAAEDRPTKTAEQAFWRALFGDHPYGRVVRADDLDKLTRSDVEGWIGRVDNVHNAALVVIGDVNAAEVEREAKILSHQLKSATWVASPPAPAPPVARPATGHRLQPVITARPGALTDLRLGCLLPPLAAADRGAYELLARGIEARLNVAVRMDQGDGYGVRVGYERLRGGTTYLVASTYLAEDGVATALAALRRQWERWERAGLDASELNVARWRYAGSFSSPTANTHELAFQLLDDWSAEPAALGKVRLRPDVAAVDAGRVNELFATCQANAVLGLTGNEPLIRQALGQAWPALAAASR